MKIDLTQPLNGINDEPLMDGDLAITLRSVLQNSLLAQMKGDEEMSGEAKAELWNLALDTRDDTVDWSPDQLVKVRERVGKGYGPVVVGPVFKLLG